MDKLEKKRTIDAGQLFLVTGGEYYDFQVYAVMVACKLLNIDELKAQYMELPEYDYEQMNKSGKEFGEIFRPIDQANEHTLYRAFVRWLETQGVAHHVKCLNLKIGDYGEFPMGLYTSIHAWDELEA